MATNCTVCGEPMQPAEAMFKFHGSLGPCPKPPLPKDENSISAALLEEADELVSIAGEYGAGNPSDSDRRHADRLMRVGEAFRLIARLDETRLSLLRDTLDRLASTPA